MKQTLNNEINLVYDYLSSWNKIEKNRNSKHIGLLSGLPGVILSLNEYSSIEFEKKYFKDYIDRTFELINKSDHLLPTYCDGLAGYGCFLLSLKNNKLLNDVELENDIDETLNDIDEILSSQIEELYNLGNLDILHGLLGIGVYFLQKNKLPETLRVIEILKEHICKTEEGYIFWKIPDYNDRSITIIDMGNAHGVCANIFFLTKALSKEFLNEEIKKELIDIIDGTIKFFLNQKQEINENIYSFYQVKIDFKDFEKNSLTPKNSRLGWCYGDLGVLYTLLMSSLKIGNSEYSNEIVTMLKHVAKREYKNEVFFTDAAFCHGTSGISILFRNIYEATKIDLFLEVSNYWLEQTLENKIKDDISYGLVIKDSDEINISILEGLAGLMVCYNKYLGKDTSISEELLMIKY